MNHNAGILIGGVTLLALFGGFFILTPGGAPREASPGDAAAALCAAFKVPVVEAKAAYVLDVESGAALFEKHADAQIPLASLTKAMTILVASRLLGPDDVVTVTKEAFLSEGEAGLFEGERWRAQDLIDFTLITSANDGAHALALASSERAAEPPSAFIERMNVLAAKDLDLSQTFYLNDTGLDVSSSTAGAYGSARDMAHFFSYLYRTEERIFALSSSVAKTFRSLSGFTHIAENTSSLSGRLPGGAVSKTGFTDLAGGNLAIIAEPLLGRPVAIVVLGSSREGRDRDAEALYSFARGALKRATLCRN